MPGGGFRWAVLGTGNAARAFTLGLRAAAGHQVDVVGSRTEARAREFRRALGLTARAERTDTALLGAVDAVFIATPPSTHRDLALAALDAGHAVLVEKPFATSEREGREIADAARTRGLFCMEAMWTRFLPLCRAVDSVLASGRIGVITGIVGSFGKPEPSGSAHVFDPARGGGALLDRGVYPLSFAIRALGEPDDVFALQVPDASGVDASCAALMRHGTSVVSVQASLRSPLSNDLRYVGSEGTIHVRGPVFRPTVALLSRGAHRSTAPLTPSSPGGNGQDAVKDRVVGDSGAAQALRQLAMTVTPEMSLLRARPIWRPYRGSGYHYQALEVARCIACGARESPLMPLSESIAVLRTVDRIRQAWSGPSGHRGSG